MNIVFLRPILINTTTKFTQCFFIFSYPRVPLSRSELSQIYEHCFANLCFLRKQGTNLYVDVERPLFGYLKTILFFF